VTALKGFGLSSRSKISLIKIKDSCYLTMLDNF
jgi:hypothetical protein